MKPRQGPTPAGQRLRASTIPALRDDGPSVDEWAADWHYVDEDDTSPHWGAPLGDATCDECGTAWPCTASAFSVGDQRCSCGGYLEWSDRTVA